MKSKYITLKNPTTMIIFPCFVKHSDIGRKYPDRLLSAGFLNIRTDNNDQITIDCFGESESLGIESRPIEDTKLALSQFSDYQ